jgi:hypothetical protein
MTKRASDDTKAVLYVQLSRDDAKSMSIENQSRALQRKRPRRSARTRSRRLG